jgi:hypothetical protein
MGKLVTTSQFANPDAAFVALVEARRGLPEAAAAALDARLVLILANPSAIRRCCRGDCAGEKRKWAGEFCDEIR